MRRRAGGENAPTAPVCHLDVCDVTEVILAKRDLTQADLPEGEWTDVELTFEVESLAWGGQFRIVSTGAAALDARYVVDYSVTEHLQP